MTEIQTEIQAESQNPLLTLHGNDLPPFAQIKIEHMAPAIDQILKENRAAIATQTAKENPTWDDVVALEILDDRLSRAWAPISHIKAVMDSAELRPIYASMMAALSAYSTEMGQNEGLYKLYQSVKASHYDSLSAVDQKILDDTLRGFQLSGIALQGEERTRYGEISQQLSKLGTTFADNVLDATRAFSIHLEDDSRLAGLPQSVLAMLKQNAEQKGQTGYLITLDQPCYFPVMLYADDRALRAQIYEAYQTRASDKGPNAGQFDNTAVMAEILALKQELAQLLGYSNYAEMSLVRKMAKDTAEVLTFLEDLGTRSHPIAAKEKDELTTWAKANYPQMVDQSGLAPWDVAYFSEKMKEAQFQVSADALLPYFPASKVCQGLFAVVQKIYGITVTERTDVETWHADVKFFEIHDQSGALRGKFYLDLFARANKRGGAWMGTCIQRFQRADYLQYPVAYITCNFAAPVGEKPALLRHSDVVTLFHEFGHGLHHMLTLQDLPSAGGMNVESDAVELPSQIMEFFCFEREGLELISGHYQTGEPLPDEMIKNLIAAKNFQSAMQTVKQIELSLFDFRLHMIAEKLSGAEIQQLLDQVRSEVAVIIPADFVRFQNAFQHIFAGGYAAGYFSYKWAELLAADGYSKFAEHGILSREIGNEFLHNVLEPGSSKPMMDLYVAFRGRKPSIDALLFYSGLAQ